MKTRNLLSKTLLAIAAATVFVSCDKIEPGNYIVYSGTTGVWENGSNVDDHSQRTIIEKYTGVRCVNCPTADMAINTAMSSYGNKLIAVSIHDSSFAFTRPIGNSNDMRSADGHALSQYFGVYEGKKYPQGLVGRRKNKSGWDLFTPTAGIEERVDAIVSKPSQIALSVSAKDNGNGIMITAQMEWLANIDIPLTLTVLITEDSIKATQRMPNGEDSTGYVHNHVLRDVITPLWGVDVNGDGKTGTCRKITLDYTGFEASWRKEKCHIVAFVSHKETMEMLNATECAIN